MPVLELPSDLNVITLADWLELKALVAGDGNASAGDLQNALQIVLDFSKSEELTVETFFELEDRLIASGEAYPFTIEKSRILQIKLPVNRYMAYIFCLCLSYFGWKQGKDNRINPRLLFEELSCIAAKQYLQGEVYLFGTGRRESGVSSFRDAVNELCFKLGEGNRIRPVNTLSKKDDHVDLVAWRGFCDRRESKLILFGQCASGHDWEEKVSELQPDKFWSHWMADSEISPLGRSFFIPHRIAYEDGEKWRYVARYAGIMFDRCRIAHWTWMDNNRVVSDSRYLEWCNSILPIA